MAFLQAGRRLVISRTFRDEDGKEFVRDEVVKRPDVIAAYIKLSSDVRSKFIQKDEVTREDMRKEKRKLVTFDPSAPHTIYTVWLQNPGRVEAASEDGGEREEESAQAKERETPDYHQREPLLCLWGGR